MAPGVQLCQPMPLGSDRERDAPSGESHDRFSLGVLRQTFRALDRCFYKEWVSGQVAGIDVGPISGDDAEGFHAAHAVCDCRCAGAEVAGHAAEARAWIVQESLQDAQVQFVQFHARAWLSNAWLFRSLRGSVIPRMPFYASPMPDGSHETHSTPVVPNVMSGDSSARDRRRARFETNQPRFKRPDIPWKKFAIPVLVVLGIGLVAGMPYVQDNYLTDKGCPGHWHASFQVYDEGEKLSFNHPRFDMNPMPMRGHLHQPNDWKMHLEGGCVTVGDFFDNMGMDLRRDSLTLDSELHGGKVLRDDGNMTLGFYVGLTNGTWIEKPDLPSYQLKDGERMLITYGIVTEDELRRQQDAIPDPLG